MTGPPPSQAQIVVELRAFIAQWFRDGREDGLHDDTPLVTSGIVDSAGVLEVVDFVESRFAVSIGDEDLSLRNCNTLRAWADLVRAKLAQVRRPGS
jgi:acyl carrier protein